MAWETPAAVWALVGVAVGAGGIALLATWLSNRHARGQLAMQLQADREQRDRERSMATRREVYIPAAEAIGRIQAVIGELADPGTDHALLSRQITADLGPLARVSVLGSDATVSAISGLTAATLLASLQLTAMRQKLLQRQGRLKAAMAAREAASHQRQQIGELLRQAFVSGNKEPALLRRLQAQFEADTQAAEARREDVERLLGEEANEERELSLRILETKQGVLRQIPDALIALRRELELPVDEAAWRRLFAERQTAALELARRLLDHAGSSGPSSQTTLSPAAASAQPPAPVVPVTADDAAPLLPEIETTGSVPAMR